LSSQDERGPHNPFAALAGRLADRDIVVGRLWLRIMASSSSSGGGAKFWRPKTIEDEYDQLLIPDKYARSRIGLQQQRQLLPIAAYRSHLLYAVEHFQTVVVISETGTGKSTQIPQYLYEAGWAGTAAGNCIVCTQPRRIAAISLANRVAQEMGTGTQTSAQVVGYSVRFEASYSESTAIKYVTDGVLLRETLTDPLLSKYTVIMVDEAHERSLHTDILLGILKKIMRKRPALRVIIASATLNAVSFKEFFELSATAKGAGVAHTSTASESSTAKAGEDTACIVNLPGKMFPVDLLYLQKPTRNVYECCVSTVMNIHRSEHPDSGDVLVFLPGGKCLVYIEP
jgi:ATP-dependent RNA helicase DDX35